MYSNYTTMNGMQIGTATTNMFGTIFDNSFHDYRLPVEDCNGERLEKGDHIVYSKGKYGYLQESIIIKVTDKSIMLKDGHWIAIPSLNKTRKI